MINTCWISSLSKFLHCLKGAAKHIPEPIGRLLAPVPYSWRLGPKYTFTRREIQNYSVLKENEQRQYIFRRVRRIVEHAYEKVPFYRTYYEDHGFSPADLQGFDDIRQIPIVRKADLRDWPLNARSHSEMDRMRRNTGGTSGSPLHFYVDRNAFAREWAHMHEVWESFGYERTNLKLTIRGHNIGARAYTYNAVHNEYIVNTYKDFDSIGTCLYDLVKNRKIEFIHGYPSAIYEFARYCRSERPELAKELGRTLRGVLLGSEYPAPVFRDTIEAVFGVPSLSWYGHSEMAVFAPERQSRFVYEPMQTYGFCEAVAEEEGQHRLLGTSYYNTASPFIRYDTGDRVGNVRVDEGVLKSFRVTSGRVGEFVVDQAGHRISLTSFIFGRHHKIFEYAEFVQVRQTEPGYITILVSPVDESEARAGVEWERLFDSSNVNMEIEFEVVEEPIRTSQGKVKLLV